MLHYHCRHTSCDDSDYDDDSEDDVEDEIGTNKQNHHEQNPNNALVTYEEQFEMAPEGLNITNPKPSKPKKRKSSKPKKTKSSKSRTTKCSKPKEKKAVEYVTTAKQRRMGSATDDLTYAWDGGTALNKQQYTTKRTHNKQSSTVADQGSSTASCVQCFDTDQL